MKALSNWTPCLADMDRGIAFFDDLTVETDRITDPRWDRVLPILQEEQIFMCRLMAPLLDSRRGALLLDIGTGSGVFALYAAKLGCRVVAIDISARALRFALQNARTNGISVVDTEPGPGEIQFLRCSYDDGTVLQNASFDYVILAPPYLPTCPGFRPALHAEAGPLGQKCFEAQLPHAGRLLKPDGVCIGNQMMVLDALGNFEAKPVLERSFPGGQFSYLRLLPEDRAVEPLLREQYRSYQTDDVDLYIRKYSPERTFALVYYELRHRANGPKQDSCITLSEDESSCERPTTTWNDRAHLHRCILEHTSEIHSFPAPALFLNVDALPLFRQPTTLGADTGSNWDASPLQYIDKWIAQSEALHPQSGLFDLLLIDSAPWYPTLSGRREIIQESAAWTAPSAGPDDASRQTLALYQDNTLRNQLAHVGTFLHPHFTGLQSPLNWRGIQFTVSDRASDVWHPEATPVDIFLQQRLDALERCTTPGAAHFISAVEAPSSFARPVHASYTSAPLSEFIADDVLESYAAGVDMQLAEMRKLCPEWKNAKDVDLYSVHLDLCHRAAHLRLDALARSSGLATSGPSTFIGIPVSLALPGALFPNTHFPDNFRGGIWIYAVARKPWSFRSEQYLLDLSRLLHILYETRYTELASVQVRRNVRHETEAAFFHQFPKDFAALDRQLNALRSRANATDADLASIRSMIPSADATAIIMMAADATVGHSHYQLLPTDIPAELDVMCTHTLAVDLCKRLVMPAIRQRICNECPDYASDSDELTPVELGLKYPWPVLDDFESFHIPAGRDLYIWLLLALRGAMYHSYLPTVSGGDLPVPGRIGISYAPDSRVVTVSNTGRAPEDPHVVAPQTGWTRDISLFKRRWQNWQISRDHPLGATGLDTGEQYSTWNETLQRWVTRIIYRESSHGRT